MVKVHTERASASHTYTHTQWVEITQNLTLSGTHYLVRNRHKHAPTQIYTLSLRRKTQAVILSDAALVETCEANLLIVFCLWVTVFLCDGLTLFPKQDGNLLLPADFFFVISVTQKNRENMFIALWCSNHYIERMKCYVESHVEWILNQFKFNRVSGLT